MPFQRYEPNPLADQSLAIVDQRRLSRFSLHEERYPASHEARFRYRLKAGAVPVWRWKHCALRRGSIRGSMMSRSRLI